MKIIFTLCSNNYLAHAKTLGDSLAVHNPGYIFIIGLVDELDEEIDYTFFEPYLILPVAKIGIPDFDFLWKKYTIVEFNTCVKASYFKYIFKTNPGANAIVFLDPDIVIYHSLKILEDTLIDDDILLTPHIMSPISLDGKEPGENTFLNYGLYNLGFIGIHRNCTNPGGFLDWWENRILNVGFHDACNGFFVDQLWINFVPLFYEKVRILRLPGIDVGPWNLHERKIQEKEPGKFKMDDGSPLYFFHFSTFRFKEPGKMSTYYNRYDFETNPELKKIYTDYYAHLMANKIEQFAAINCKYVERRNQYIESQAVVPSKAAQIVKKIKSGIKLFIPPVILKIKNSLN